METTADTIWLIALVAYFCCVYVRDLYMAAKAFEDFEAMDEHRNFEEGVRK